MYSLRLQLFILIIFCFFCGQSFSQVIDKQKLYDSLIVNTWKTENVKIGGEIIDLTKEQKNGRLVFHKNHKSENIFKDLKEKGKWVIDANENELSISIDILPNEEPISFKIILLTKDKLVMSVKNHDSQPSTEFTCIPE